MTVVCDSSAGVLEGLAGLVWGTVLGFAPPDGTPILAILHLFCRLASQKNRTPSKGLWCSGAGLQPTLRLILLLVWSGLEGLVKL